MSLEHIDKTERVEFKVNLTEMEILNNYSKLIQFYQYHKNGIIDGEIANDQIKYLYFNQDIRGEKHHKKLNTLQCNCFCKYKLVILRVCCISEIFKGQIHSHLQGICENRPVIGMYKQTCMNIILLNQWHRLCNISQGYYICFFYTSIHQ